MRRLAFAAAAALLLTSIPAGTIRAAIPPDGVVAFRDHCTGRLYAMNPDGTGRHLLPDVGAGGVVDVSRGVGPVTVLAAGQRALPGGGSKPTLYAIDASGTHAPVDLLDETEPTPSEAALSPTGDRVAFVHKYWDPVAEVGHADLGIGDVIRDAGSGAIIDVDNVTFIVDLWTLGSPADTIGDNAFTGPLDFAPDGRRLVVTIYDDLWELTLDPDTGRTLVEARPITRTTSFAERMPSWSPIAEMVAITGGPYSSSGGGPLVLYTSSMQIHTLDIATGGARQVTNSKNKGSSGDGRNNPAWSRNGSYLLFDALGPAAFGKRGQSSCGGSANSDLFQIPADGSLKAVNVTNTSGTGVEYGPAWGW